MAIYILTDSSADLLPDAAERRGVWVAPLKVQFGEEAYQSGPDDFLPWFERVKESGDSLICLPIASSLSGTYQSARIAKELCGYENIYVVDSTQAALGRHRCEVYPVGPVIGTHVGPGAAVIVYLEQEV